jgi:hypothetical protein
MAKHMLSLEMPDTLNDCIMCIMDTSIYADKVPVECPYLDILPPGFTCAVRLDVEPGFCQICLTACDLGFQTNDCGNTFDTIPDGVYVVKYSVAPNEYVFVEYNHLRITSAMKKVNDVLCGLDLAACDPLPEIKEKLKELRLIQVMLQAAKSKVEYCHTPSHGMDLYEYAVKRLNKLLCTIC